MVVYTSVQPIILISGTLSCQILASSLILSHFKHGEVLRLS